MRNEQVAHVWAQGNGETARSENLRCEDNRLISYSTEIARLDNDYAYISGMQYSVTTTRHLSYARQALASHIHTIYISGCNVRDFNPDNPRNVLTQVWLHARDLNNAVAKIRRARTYPSGSEALRLIAETRRLLDILEHRHGVDAFARGIDTLNCDYHTHKLTGSELALATDTLNTLLEAGKRVSILDVFDRLIPEYADIVARCEARQQQADSKKQAQRERERQELERTQRENISRWLAGEGVNISAISPTLLRVRGDVVQTSRGAEVPLGDAVKMFARFERGELVAGDRIGHFTVSAITPDAVIIGCHTLQISVLREFFRAASLAVA